MSVDPASKPRNETEHERLDRQLMELLQGFRVATTGVQVLFAFLLTVPFSARFDEEVGETGRVLFYVALFGAGLASVCFIAPVIQHRILFRLGQKALLIRRANRFGIAGAFALGVSMTAATTLLVESLSDEAAAAAATAAVAVVLGGWAWFVQPYLTRRRTEARAPEAEES
ncbi:DUF6328 family protein [Actinomadura mexicana]|uniref:Uncharacterized protein n=1 Tax=Actinomadura mexicana TaxID=134959 RepID=A0A238WPE6_9ACTN|nr:DUF6328 family protein [Actinomadura mexicana]SNR48124.1 hypothetical protein SAMN06265355_103100 [Actinomadura mexicana]